MIFLIKTIYNVSVKNSKEEYTLRKYFGTDGIRRIANTELTPELVYRVAKAGAYVLAKHLDHAPTIFIGRDTRLSGTLIESAMTAGFLSYGANVKLLGVMPTPAVAYLTRKLKADASVVISASHNTFEFSMHITIWFFTQCHLTQFL